MEGASTADWQPTSAARLRPSSVGAWRLFERGRLAQRQRLAAAIARPVVEAQVERRGEVQHGESYFVLSPGRSAASAGGLAGTV